MARQTSGGSHLITTSPSLIQCSTCRRPVLAATVEGLDVHIDTAMLNRLGEAMALLEGRATYNLSGDRLWRRGPEKIREATAKLPVLARHACKDAPLEHLDNEREGSVLTLVLRAVGGVIVGQGVIAYEPPF